MFDKEIITGNVYFASISIGNHMISSAIRNK